MGYETIAGLVSGQVAGFLSSSDAVVGVGSVLGLFVCLFVCVCSAISLTNYPRVAAKKIIVNFLGGRRKVHQGNEIGLRGNFKLVLVAREL